MSKPYSPELQDLLDNFPTEPGVLIQCVNTVPDWKEHREVVQRMLTVDGVFLILAPAFHKDRELVMLALKTNGGIFPLLNDSLKADREVVALAVRVDGSYLKDAAPALRKDREMVKLALGGGAWQSFVFDDLDAALQQDPELRKIALKNLWRLHTQTQHMAMTMDPMLSAWKWMTNQIPAHLVDSLADQYLAKQDLIECIHDDPEAQEQDYTALLKGLLLEIVEEALPELIPEV